MDRRRRRTRAAASLVAAAAVAVVTSAVGCTDPVLAPPPGATRANVFDAVWREADLHYSMFELKHVNWDSLGAAYGPRAAAAPSDSALARVIGGMLLALRDRHVSLSPGPRAEPMAFLTAADSAPPVYDASVVEQRYLAGNVTVPGTHLRFGQPAPGVGYIRIPSFADAGWVSELDAALAALDGVQSLIVDVRCNPGGNYDIAVEAAARFADQDRVFGHVRIRNGPGHGDFTSSIDEHVAPAGPRQFRGRVYVLTNRKVYSAAENFVLALRAMPNVVTVGDTTAGSSGKPIVRELANGWTYQLSSWIEYTPAGQAYEDVGLAPVVFVHARIEEIRAGSDVVLERALQLAAGA